MLLAIEQMDPVVQGIFFLVAVVCFVIAALRWVAFPFLIAVGLAFFTAVFMWNAFAAA